MIILCSGLIIALGYTMIGANNQAEQLITSNAGYANQLKAQNTAQIAIQFAVEKINEDPDFANTYNSETTAWNKLIEGAETNVWVEVISQTTNDSGLEETTFRISANSVVKDKKSKVVSLYRKNELHFVPEFKSVISFTNNNFTFLMADSASLNGSDPLGGCEDMPGIVTTSESDSAKIADNSNGQIQGSPPIKVDDNVSYNSVGELINYLENIPEVNQISGNYMGALGDSTNPGVFFVTSPANIESEINEGYGILVFKDDGRLYYNGTSETSKNLTFKGLVVFENAQDFKTESTPSISGSVVIGATEASPTLDIVLNGAITISRDCDAQRYARRASALILDEDGFKRIVTFE